MGQQCRQGRAGAMMAIESRSVWSLIACTLGIVPIRVCEFMDQYVQGMWSLWMFEGYTEPVCVYEC